MSFPSLMYFAASFVLLSGACPLPAEAVDQGHYVRNAQSQIDHLTDEIRRVEHKVPHLRPDMKAECQETLGKMWKKERLARIKLEAIKNASPAQWQKLRKEEDSILIHLNKSYRHLMNRYFL